MNVAHVVLVGRNARPVPLESARVTIGRTAAVSLADITVSRLHAVIEQLDGTWVLQDLGSRNGTFVNGDRLLGRRALRDGDAIRCGSSQLTFRCRTDPIDGAGSTAPLDPAPRLTHRERQALVALCRPLLGGSVLAEPASIRAIAAELVISESGAKKLLGRVYERFELRGDERRRQRLALDALRRGAVSVGDLASEPAAELSG